VQRSLYDFAQSDIFFEILCKGIAKYFFYAYVCGAFRNQIETIQLSDNLNRYESKLKDIYVELLK
jgi:hypothetical protein